MVTVLLLKDFRKDLNIHYSHGLEAVLPPAPASNRICSKLSLVIPVSITAQGRVSSWFPAIVCNTLAFISEPFCLLTAPHLCHHIHNTKFELPPYHLVEICFLFAARNCGERRSSSCHNESFCIYIE